MCLVEIKLKRAEMASDVRREERKSFCLLWFQLFYGVNLCVDGMLMRQMQERVYLCEEVLQAFNREMDNFHCLFALGTV